MDLFTHVLVREFDEGVAPRLALEHSGLVKHEVHLGDLAKLAKDLDESVFVHCWRQVADK